MGVECTQSPFPPCPSSSHCTALHCISALQISGHEEKKRESIMVVANQTKSRLQLAEDALHRVQVGGGGGGYWGSQAGLFACALCRWSGRR